MLAPPSLGGAWVPVDSVRSILGRAVTGAENVAEDDRLLAEGKAAVRVARLSDTSVSIGVAQSARTACARAANAAGIPLVHRSTGGTGLLHLPGDLAWSVVLPRRHPMVGSDYAKGYARLGAGVVDALRARDVPAAWTPPIGVAPEYCFLGPRGEALSVGGRVLGGAAQHLTSRALLHQGVVARRVDVPQLERLFGLRREVSERHLTGLADWDLDSAPELFAKEVLGSLVRRVEHADARPHRD